MLNIYIFVQFIFNSYFYFRHKKTIYYKIYIQLVRINKMIYSGRKRNLDTSKTKEENYG